MFYNGDDPRLRLLAMTEEEWAYNQELIYKDAVELLIHLANNEESPNRDKYHDSMVMQTDHELTPIHLRSDCVFIEGSLHSITNDTPPIVWLRDGVLLEPNNNKRMKFGLAKAHMNGQTKLPASKHTVLYGELLSVEEGTCVEIRYAEVYHEYRSKKNRQ